MNTEKSALYLEYNILGLWLHTKGLLPDPPYRCHLPFDRPFDKLTVLSTSALLGVEGLMALRILEGLRCLRSLLLAAYFIYASLVAPWRLASNIYMVARVIPKSRANMNYLQI